MHGSDFVPADLIFQSTQQSDSVHRSVTLSSQSFPQQRIVHTSACDVLPDAGYRSSSLSSAIQLPRHNQNDFPMASDPVPERPLGGKHESVLQKMQRIMSLEGLQREPSVGSTSRPRCLPPCTWVGRGCPPQLPWSTPFCGTLLVISLFDGMGGLLLALLALSVKFFYVAVECDLQASPCVRKNVFKMISFPDVTKVHFSAP